MNSGTTLALFQSGGMLPLVIDSVNSFVIGLDSSRAHSLRTLEEMLSEPGALFGSIFMSSLRTLVSLKSTVSRLGSSCISMSGRSG